MKCGPWAIGTRIRCIESPQPGYSNIQKGDTGVIIAGKPHESYEKLIKIDKKRKIYAFDIVDMHCYKKLDNLWTGQHRVRRRGVYASRR